GAGPLPLPPRAEGRGGRAAEHSPERARPHPQASALRARRPAPRVTSAPARGSPSTRPPVLPTAAMAVNELLTLTLTELCETLRRKRASPVDVMQAVLARIDETNPDLNAVCSRRDPGDCLADARAAEARLTRSEATALRGIPLGVKELEHAARLPATQA